MLTLDEEAIIVAFRRHKLLPLDDCLCSLQPSIPHLTRLSLHRCLQRHDINRLPEVDSDKPANGVCQTSCPPISCGVSDFGGADFVFGVEPDGSGGMPVAGFA